MIKRNHPLFVGEKVFEVNMMYIYHITAINEDGTISLSMTGDDIAENLKMFDCELEESDYETDSDELAVYQFAKGIVDRRGGNPVCFEHDTEIGKGSEDYVEGELYYPYFSPYLEENLFTFETMPEEQNKPVAEFDLPTNELDDVITTLTGFEVAHIDKHTPVVVEDENGRIEHIGHMWFDPLRGMIRMSVKGVEFKDAEE